MLSESLDQKGCRSCSYTSTSNPTVVAKHQEGQEQLLRDLAEITLGDWYRVGRDRVGKVTAMAGIFHDRVVTVFPATFDPEHGYDPKTERYSLLSSPSPDPADSLAGLLGQHVTWGRGNPTFKDSPEWPLCEGGDAGKQMLQLLDDYAHERVRPSAPRPEMDDPLLSRVKVTRNPRGGIVVTVPAGTNVLIRNGKGAGDYEKG